ncbi:PucR family transcriptional regulator [Nocardia vaccinii]|uniref:PucR family transcriptional regulator n=1 Tax=Nocardia vaccinii TaxID=1822 RepID=UPI001C3FA1B6|nr:helix-turn-helix domain-containing protein [Nocardia vaccinii]
MSTAEIDRIIDAMRHERYRFAPVRRTLIPKKNGKTRPLGLPTWSDKLVGVVARCWRRITCRRAESPAAYLVIPLTDVPVLSSLSAVMSSATPEPDDGKKLSVLSWRLRLETALSGHHAEIGTLSGLVAALATSLVSTVFLLGPAGRVISGHNPPNMPASIPSLERLKAGAGVVGEGGPAAISRIGGPAGAGTYVIASIVEGDHLFGWVVALIGDADSDQFCWAVDRAVVHFRMEFVAQRRLARVAGTARANLARHMVRSSTYDSDLRACAEYLGVDLAAERVVVFVLERGRPSDAAVDGDRLGSLVANELAVDVLGFGGTEGITLLIAAPPGADKAAFVARCKSAVTMGLGRMGDRFAVAGVSSVTRPGQLRRAYREAFEAARCLDRYPSDSTSVIACDELGPARLLVANSNEQSVRTYVYDVLGALISGGTINNDLLRTLQAFFESGRNVRETAARLGIHENTVRHRLARVHDLTGLDVASESNDQLSVQTALLILRLQGHHAVPGFDAYVVTPGAPSARN